MEMKTKKEVEAKWEMTELGNLIEEITDKRKHSNYPVYSVTNSNGFTPSEDYFSKQVFSKDLSNYKIVQKNQFAYNPSRINVGSIDFLNEEKAVLVSPLYVVFRCADRIIPQYLKYFIRSSIGLAQIASKTSGSVRDSLKFSGLSKILIPLPPLATQQRIAAILDAADALRRKDQELLRKYDELAQAIFIDMFGDPVKNEKGWDTVLLGNCLKNIQIGPFGTQLHESDYIKNGIPIINPMHIGDLKIKPDYNYSISEEKFKTLSQYHLKTNDVILGRRGEMGRCALVPESIGTCLCGTGSLFMTVDEEKLNATFLVYLLSRKSTKIALENISSGTTMSNLNKNIINEFQIILPDIESQNLFEHLINVQEMNIFQNRTLIRKTDSLFHSLLQQAFSGELKA